MQWTCLSLRGNHKNFEKSRWNIKFRNYIYITNFYWDEIGCITIVDDYNGIDHGYTLLYKTKKTPIVTMGSEKDCCLSKSGPHHTEMLIYAGVGT